MSGTPTGPGFTAVAGNGETFLALTANGSIVQWGADNNGQQFIPFGSGFTTIAVGSNTDYALTANGSIDAWGYDAHGEVSNATTGSGYTAISGGQFTAYALSGSDSSAGTSESGSVGLLVGIGITGVSLFARRRRNAEHLST